MDARIDQAPNLRDLSFLALLLLSAVAAFAAMQLETRIDPLLSQLEVIGWHRAITRPGLVFAYLGVALTAFRALLWYRYRPAAIPHESRLPRLTVIIPAFNEGEMVTRSIASVVSAEYPVGRLDVVVVDDGSTDDTWDHIQRAAAQHSNLVRTVRFAKNQGKRAALAEGFRQALGTIAVTIDSDSVIEKHTLLAMAAPFENPRVGAVAGRVAVLNRHAGLIPRMLHVRYALSFDFLRAAQSTYGSVYCCPGALAGYRMSVVRRVLAAWLEQRFLGAACTIGEDRAMTNLILAERHDVVYQRNAVVHTLAPLTYRALCKMFLRWDRSYVREEFRLAALLRRRPLLPAMFIGLDIAASNAGYLFGYAALILSLGIVAHHPHVGLYLLLGIGFGASINTLYFLRSERSWHCLYGLVYGYYAAFALAWILPYAALTVRTRGWLTR